jgi:alpha-L-rhamnosidase
MCKIETRRLLPASINRHTPAMIKALSCLAIVAGNCAAAALAPVELRCDHAADPGGVDSANPRLSWELASPARGQKQAAYEILAASSEQILGHNRADLWDSGKVISDETVQISFPENLNSFEEVFWKVRVWDENGKASAWSRPASWTMGVLDTNDWHAQWIGAVDTNIPSLLLRDQFSIKPNLKRALINICGLGQYELTLNGRKIGNDFLSPGWTKYDRTCLYDTFDVTKDLSRGKNAIGIELGNGMYRVLGGGRFTKQKARSARKKPSSKSALNTPTARWNSSARMKIGKRAPARSHST